jgi:hypothetical protein
MEKFADCFVRTAEGVWFCRGPVHIVGPQGPATFTPGVTYKRGKGLNGYDVAQWLDDWFNHRREPMGIRFL